MRYVISTVLNRKNSPKFPDTISDVIYQKGQFSVVGTKAFKKAVEAPPEDAMEAVLLEEAEQIDTNVFYFCSGGWPGSGHRYKQVKDHYFNSL